MSKKWRNRAGVSKKRRNRSSSFDWGRLANRLQIILALVVPFVFLRGLSNYIELPRGALIQVVALILLLIWLLGAISLKELKIIRTPFDLPLLGLVLWSGLSLLWAHNFYDGFDPPGSPRSGGRVASEDKQRQRNVGVPAARRPLRFDPREDSFAI